MLHMQGIVTCCRHIVPRSCRKYFAPIPAVNSGLGGGFRSKQYYYYYYYNYYARFMGTLREQPQQNGHIHRQEQHEKQHADQQQNESTNSSRADRRRRDKLITGCVIGGGVLAVAGYFWYTRSKELSPEEILKFTLRMGVQASQKEQFEKAQAMFHRGLELAQIQHAEKLIDDKQLLVMQINIFGLMATTAVRSGDFENAEKLYKDTMQKCISAGRPQDDDSVVELSIKLASLYAMMSRDEEAHTGFKFCVNTMEAKVKALGGVVESDTNTLALQGLSVQSYARFLMKNKNYSQAIDLYKQSLDVAREVYGADHPQALVVLNDLASAYVINKQYKEGIEAYKEAISRAEKSETMGDSLVAFYYNLGEACILTKDFEAAKSHCVKCLEVANKIGNPALVKAGERCVKDVQEVKAKEGRKT